MNAVDIFFEWMDLVVSLAPKQIFMKTRSEFLKILYRSYSFVIFKNEASYYYQGPPNYSASKSPRGLLKHRLSPSQIIVLWERRGQKLQELLRVVAQGP